MAQLRARRWLVAGLSAALSGWPGGALAGPQEANARPPASGPGLFRLGPVYVTPTLTIGQIGIDSNVFYAATDRQVDFVADGGPGLELRVPVGQSVLIGADGGVGFLYFAKTESQRRTTGHARVFLNLEGSRTGALAAALVGSANGRRW